MKPDIERSFARFSVLPILIIFTMLSFAPGPVSASKWEFDIGLKCTYDDNVLNYSEADLDLFDSIGAAPGGRFGIESKDDFIFSPSFRMIYKSELLGHTFQAGFNSVYNFNIKNDKRRYYSGGIWAREYLRKGTYIQASINYLPDYYYRNLQTYDGDYKEAEFAKIGADLTLYSILMKKITGKAYLGYERKNFNDSFNERDLHIYCFGFELGYRFTNANRLIGGYEFTAAKSRGRNSEAYRRDTSYDMFSFWGGARLTAHGLSGKRLLVSPKLGYRLALYQTEKLTQEDRFRFGREDTRLRAGLDLRQTLNHRTELLIGAGISSNESDLPASDAKRFLDYSSFTINIGFDYSF